MGRKIAFIVNPVSGVHHWKKEKLPSILSVLFKNQDIEYEILNTQYAGHAVELAKSAIDNQFDTVVAVGGDGSVNEIASALTGTSVKLGIIPLGSGNGLARFLQIPFGLDQSLAVILKNKSIKSDTIIINNLHFMVSIAGIGFDARIARLFAHEKKRGFFTYLKITLNQYFTYRPKKYHITTENQNITTRSLFISIANSNQFGYNTTIAPQADITDGLADIVIVNKVPFYKTPFIASLLFRKKIDSSRYVTSLKSSEFTISRKKGKYINIDGEPVKVGKTLHFKVIKHSLNILVP